MTFASKRFVERLANERAPGPPATFSFFHVFFVLEILAEKPMGRNMLAAKINVGEGAIRTIISRLKDAGLIVTSKAGCSLTPKGVALWKEFEEVFPKRFEVHKNDLATSPFNYAFLVKNVGHKIKSGIEQRDEAVVAGARKAIAIVNEGGCLTIKTVSSDVKRDFPKAIVEILKHATPNNNDVILIAGADTLFKAKHGSFAASWMLLDPGKKMSLSKTV